MKKFNIKVVGKRKNKNDKTQQGMTYKEKKMGLNIYKNSRSFLRSILKTIILINMLLLVLHTNLYSKNISLFGINTHYSFISSYYSIESATLKKEGHTSYSDGLGVGMFFDYKYSPYSGVKFIFSVLYRDYRLFSY